MGRRTAVLALTLLVVCAGCFAPFDGDSTPPSDGEATVTEGDTETPAERANPWGTETVTVGVEQPEEPWRDVTAMVAGTLDYWERNAAEYGRYEVGFELRPNAAEPDVIVRYVEDISVCGSPNRDGGSGFAPVVSPAHPPEPPESICVRHGYDDASTRHVLKHEFGHLLGIQHGDPPEELMAADYQIRQVPRPAQAVRSAPAVDSPVAVYVDRSAIYARRDYVAQRQLEHAFSYYEGTAALPVDAPINITTVEERDAADIVFSFPQQSPCNRDGVGSCAEVTKRSDGQLQTRVAIPTTHEDTYGWHAGFWLGIALGVETHRELPSPFRNASFDDRHSAWWESDT